MFRNERGIDRRRAPRRLPAADEPLSCVRLRAGRDLVVINISDLGCLVEGTMRLRPGTSVDVHVVTARGRVLARSRVVWARVCRLSASDIRYAGALAFEQRVDTNPIGYGVPVLDPGPTAAEGKAYPKSGDIAPNTVRSAAEGATFANDRKVAPPLE